MPEQMPSGQDLMRRRTNLGLTGQQIAGSLGISQQTISNLENSNWPWSSKHYQPYTELLDQLEGQRYVELENQHPALRATTIYELLLDTATSGG